jgi:hypothetical protein
MDREMLNEHLQQAEAQVARADRQVVKQRWTVAKILQRNTHAPVIAEGHADPRSVQTVGQTLAVPILGGLHHQYIRV